MGEDVFTALDAVVFGSLLITLLRHADRVKIGCQSLLVNAVGPIMTEPGQSAWRQAIFHPMAQVAHWARGEVLRLEPVCATIETADHGHVPVLEAVATVDHAAPALTLFVMNRAQDEPVDLDCDVRAMALIGAPEHLVLDGRDPESRNTRENPDRVLPRRSDALQIHAGRLRVRLEPISWNVIRVPLRSPP